jgi:undecaprenyl diphosphate synthase
MVIEKILKKKINLNQEYLPKHIAIVIDGILIWGKNNKKNIIETLNLSNQNLNEIIYEQIKLNIPISTIYLKTKNIIKNEFKDEIIQNISNFLSEIKKENFIHKNKIKFSVLGKWYDLPSNLVDEIKDLIDETKYYDNFFVNLCLNYNGQEEIVDACKIIGKKIEAGILNTNQINKDIIKENLYSSYFLPPDLIIVTGNKNSTHGLLLWDSINSIIYFSNVLWPDFKKQNLIKSIYFYQKNKLYKE